MKKHILKTIIVVISALLMASLCAFTLAACNNKTETPSDTNTQPSEKEPYEFDYDFSHYKQVFFQEEKNYRYSCFDISRNNATVYAEDSSYFTYGYFSYQIAAEETKIALNWTFTPKATGEYNLRINTFGMIHDFALQKVFVNGEELQGQFDDDYYDFSATLSLKYLTTCVITAYFDFRDEIFFKSESTGIIERVSCKVYMDLYPQISYGTKDTEIVIAPNDYYVLYYVPESYNITEPDDLIELTIVDDVNPDVETSNDSSLYFLVEDAVSYERFFTHVKTTSIRRGQKESDYSVLIIHNRDSVPHKLQLKETVISE